MVLERIKSFRPINFLYTCLGIAPLYHFVLACAGAMRYGFPSKRIFVIGVTGTKGKTTVLELLNSILESAGKKTALLSSIAVKVGDDRRKNTSDLTMPGRFFIQRFLHQAAMSGCAYALLEVTSQGVAQHRHRFIEWRQAVLINLAPEHIEAHGSFEGYRDAKLRFLLYAQKKGAKIFINKDDGSAGYFLKALGRTAYGYSKDDARIFPAQSNRFFQADFNRENIAAAAALAEHIGVGTSIIEKTIREFPGVPGRMEFVQKTPFAVVVDYAHTPGSLEAVYKALKGVNPKPKKLICVLGSAGGGRDAWKRPVMGKIAARYCDTVILTNEDPYDENPAGILSEIEAGFSQIPNNHFKILDRKEAIEKAVSLAGKGDTVVVTGKGSELWLHKAHGEKISWDERAIVEEILKKKTRAF